MPPECPQRRMSIMAFRCGVRPPLRGGTLLPPPWLALRVLSVLWVAICVTPSDGLNESGRPVLYVARFFLRRGLRAESHGFLGPDRIITVL
jgi:hypothetical protein